MALLLDCEISELMFQVEGNQRLSSSIKLQNTSENHVAFKILCTKPKRYGVHPWIGVLSPGGSCEVTVKTQAPRRAPTNMQNWQSRDIFKIQSVLARPGTTKEDAPNLFNTAVAHMIEESRLQVVYTLPQAHNSTESLTTTSEVDESESIVESSASQVVPISVRGRAIRIGGLILMCVIGVVVSYYLMKQTCCLIWTLTKLMAMLMMKMVTKSASDWIEDWVGKTLLCVFMSILCKYEERLRHIMLCVWDRVMGLANREIKFIQIPTTERYLNLPRMRR